MKTSFFLIIVHFFLFSCNNDDENTQQQLPPITTTGENTFGCIIDGKLFYPRDGDSGLGGSGANAISIFGDIDGSYIEISVNNFKDGKPINNFI